MNVFRLFLIHPIFFFKLYFRWHNIKYGDNCDPMEKILIKKELYVSSYEVLNF